MPGPGSLAYIIAAAGTAVVLLKYQIHDTLL